MPHDKNGRKLFVGDVVRAPKGDGSGHFICGVVSSITPSAISCNMSVVEQTYAGTCPRTCTANQCELIVTRDGHLPDVRIQGGGDTPQAAPAETPAAPKQEPKTQG